MRIFGKEINYPVKKSNSILLNTINMKNVKYILLAFIICMAGYAHATVRTLNNNNPSPGQYNTWATVEAASSIGDTVYVSGSPLSYGDITVSVYNLCLIGTGYNPQKQNPMVSEFGDIDATVGQIRMIGLKCKSVDVQPILGAAALHASYCHMVRVGILSSTGYDGAVYLRNNVITGELSGGYNFLLTGTNTNNLSGEIANNICFGELKVQNSFIMGLNIFNNIFIADSTYGTQLFGGGPQYYYSSVFKNNILLNYHDDGIIFNSNPSFIGLNVTFYNNVVYSSLTALPNFGNNIGMITTNPLFVNVPCASIIGNNCLFDLGYDYHLSALSPAKNAGTDGTDIGPFGGPYGVTFNTFGEPPIPQIKQMNMPASVSSGQSFNVNIISTVK
jgi:hypothetical protein